MPRNDSVDSCHTAWGSITTTASPACPATAGSTWWRTNPAGEAPATREAATYPEAMTFCVSARTILATGGQWVSARARTRAVIDPRNRATTTTVANRCGTAATASVRRMSSASTRAPPAEAAAPTATPIAAAATAEPAATARETRSACATRTEVSWPSVSVPMRCGRPGASPARR